MNEETTNQGTSNTPELGPHSVVKGDFFMLAAKKGYAPFQRRDAMQVMECWDSVMTVKCKGGCMTKGYGHFEKVTDLSVFSSVHRYDGDMEDRRSLYCA